MSEHVRYAGPLRWDVCAACHEPWPCPAAAAEQFAATKAFCEQQVAGDAPLPRVGAEITGEAQHMLWCGYAPQPGDPTCGRPGTIHLADADWRGMTSCDEHVGIARAAGGIREHSTTDSACAMPEAMWVAGPPSRCVIDDSGVEPFPAHAERAATPALSTCPRCGHAWSWHDATRCSECDCKREAFEREGPGLSRCHLLHTDPPPTPHPDTVARIGGALVDLYRLHPGRYAMHPLGQQLDLGPGIPVAVPRRLDYDGSLHLLQRDRLHPRIILPSRPHATVGAPAASMIGCHA